MNGSCSTCKFFEPDNDECHRYPPPLPPDHARDLPNCGSYARSEWPRVHYEWTCGEWQSLPEYD